MGYWRNILAAASSKTTAQIGEVAEAANPWMQLLINYTTTINPVDNPNPPELLPVYATGRLQRLYLPLIRR